MWRRFLPLFLVLVILLSIGYFFLSLPPKSVATSSQLSSQVGCADGSVASCSTEDGCEGNIVCNKGKWSNCVVEKVCIPGSKKECAIGCDTGYEECNECGTEYSECIISNN